MHWQQVLYAMLTKQAKGTLREPYAVIHIMQSCVYLCNFLSCPAFLQHGRAYITENTSLLATIQSQVSFITFLLLWHRWQ